MHPLGARGSISGPLGHSPVSLATAGRWLSGGIAAANCIAAYEPKGAASLEASYDNKAAPGNGLPDGTYDAAPGGFAPPWNTVTGWNFATHSSRYLTTGIVPTINTWSYFVRFTNGVASYTGRLFGSYGGSDGKLIEIYPYYLDKVYYSNGGKMGVGPGLTAGALAIAGSTAYRDGNPEPGAIPAGAGVVPALAIGCLHTTFSYEQFVTASIQYFYVYNIITSAAQNAALAAATV